MLAGPARIRLLRQIHAEPNRCVSLLGRSVGLREPAASQELRRIQSRGLLQASRQGPALIYRLEADPQVPTAGPLLKAIQTALASLPPEKDMLICQIAGGLAHERRIRMARELMAGPVSPTDLQFRLHIPGRPFALHLKKLTSAGFVTSSQGHLRWSIPDHPLGKALAKLLQQGVAR